MKKSLIVPLGPHGAGKTTLAAEIAKDFAIPFYGEIGTLLRLQDTRPVNVMQRDFDREVLKGELARDESISRGSANCSVVETWHLGNMAFAATRAAGDLTFRYQNILVRQLDLFRVAPIRLQISDGTFSERCSEKQLETDTTLAFYRRVESELVSILVQFSRQMIDPLVLPEDVTLADARQQAYEWVTGQDLV